MRRARSCSAISGGGDAQNAAAPPGGTSHSSGRPGENHLGALPTRGLEPEVDDRRPLDDRVVADDEADLRVQNRGERRAEGVEDRIEVVGEERHRGGAEALAGETRKRGRVLDGLGSGERDDDRPGRLAEPALGLVEGLLDRHLVEAAPADPEQRLPDPVARPEMAEGEAALVAEPAVIHFRVVPREHPLALSPREW